MKAKINVAHGGIDPTSRFGWPTGTTSKQRG